HNQAGAGQGRGPVQVADADPAHRRHAPSRAGDDAEHDRDREQHQGHDAGAAAERPERAGQPRLAHAATSWGQPPTRTTRWRWATRGAVSPRWGSQAAASRPSTIAAVDAVLASTQV